MPSSLTFKTYYPMVTKHFNCPDCHNINRLRTFAPDRVELEREKGIVFAANCSHCHQQVNVHVNKVRARPMNVITYVVWGLVFVILGLAFLMGMFTNIYGLLQAAGIIGIPVLVQKAVHKQADTFNSYHLRE